MSNRAGLSISTRWQWLRNRAHDCFAVKLEATWLEEKPVKEVAPPLEPVDAVPDWLNELYKAGLTPEKANRAASIIQVSVLSNGEKYFIYFTHLPRFVDNSSSLCETKQQIIIYVNLSAESLQEI